MATTVIPLDVYRYIKLAGTSSEFATDILNAGLKIACPGFMLTRWLLLKKPATLSYLELDLTGEHLKREEGKRRLP
jgi:hypothetical protein